MKAEETLPDTSPGWSRPSRRLATALDVARLAGIAMAVVWTASFVYLDVSTTGAVALAVPLVALVAIGGLWGGYVIAMRTHMVASFDLGTAEVVGRVRRALDAEGIESEGMSEEERSLMEPGVELLQVRRGTSTALVAVVSRRGRTRVDISRVNQKTWPFIREVSIVVMDALGGEMHRVDP